MPTSRPPFDPELSAVLTSLGEQLPSTVTPEMIEQMRAANITSPIEELLAARPGVSHREERVPGYGGAELLVSIFTNRSSPALAPGFFHTHGGGMISGDRFTGIEVLLDWVERFDGVCVSVEYRLAPEFGDPCPVEDCYAALAWTAEHATDLGIDPNRLIIAGGSSGGGLAAGVTLLARDRQGPALAGQVLMYPMLDDRNDTVSAHQIDRRRRLGPHQQRNGLERPARRLGEVRRARQHLRGTRPGHRPRRLFRPPLSTSAAPRSSVTRTSATPPLSGPAAGRPNCTSGPGAFTAST